MLWKLAGGVRGILLIAAVAALGTLVPGRFGYLFLDPAILLLYTAVALVFSSNFVTRGAVGEDDFTAVRRMAVSGALFGWVCWLVILGAALGSLAAAKGRLLLPPVGMSIGLTLFVLSAAWCAACLAAVISASVSQEKTAREMVRMLFFFMLLILLAGPKVLPGPWRDELTHLVVSDRLVGLLFAASPVLLALGWVLLQRTGRIIDERNAPLSLGTLDR